MLISNRLSNLLTVLSTKLLRLFILLVILTFTVPNLFAQSLKTDSLTSDSIIPKKPQNFILESRIIRTAKDSVKINYKTQKAYLFGNAKVEYENITLEAAYIEIDFVNNTVYATGMPDSSGKMIGEPVFKEGADEYKTTVMKYNFTTRKGLVYNVTKQDGDAYIFLAEGKKMPDNTTYVHKGHFTTCSLPHPHYSIRYNKGKIIPDDKIVTGPIYMEIEDIPIPLVLPFGFFPNKRGRANGILIPSYGYTENRGYFLSNGGYYIGLGEHVDLALRGDIYTKGSWALRALSNYNWRYKANGNVQVQFAKNKYGETDTDNYSEEQQYFINWFHRQDPKANPNSNFTANVNFGSTQYNKLNSYNANDIVSNEFQSSISYSTRIGNNNLNININHNQNSSSHQMTLLLPTLTFSTQRINPFQRKLQVGKTRWYEKINFTYNMEARNQLITTDSMLSKTQFSDFDNGIKHNIPLSVTIPVGYFNWTNNINLNEYWYFSTINKTWDPNLIVNNVDTGGVVSQENLGFSAAHDVSFSSGMSTRIYGMFGLKYGPVRYLRHVLTPTASFSYRPNISKELNYYREYVNDDGDVIRYTIYEGGIFGSPPDGKSGAINLSLNNTLEAKIRSKKDTVTGMKKIRIIESFTLGTSYDLAKEEFQLAPLSVLARTTILKQIGVQFTGNWDFYAFDPVTKTRINKLNWEVNNKLLRQNSYNINLTLNYSLSANTFKNKKKPKPEYKSEQGSSEELRQVNTFPEHYVDFNNPWNVTVNYSYVYTDAFNTSQNNYIRTRVTTLNFSGDVNITKKWKIGVSSGYDFTAKDLTFTTIDIYRDLHCWELMFNWIPTGFRRSFNLTVRVKSPLLQDLKLTKKRDWRDF
ncbi:MAG: LPS-assembly protein LptD [Bacteroidales bacterium]|nr:LPS-assembly protein LptD [Bacteroidales bacterium]